MPKDEVVVDATRRLAVILSGAKNLVQAFQDLRQLLRRCSAEAIPDPLGRERSDLADLHAGNHRGHAAELNG